MARAPSRFDRKKPSLKQQARVLVLCEDSKSSRLYLQDAANHFRAYAEVEIAHCGKNDPKGIVAEAVKRQKLFDDVYCVIDRDSDPKFDAALIQAAAHAKVTVIASYPCYEYWLLLHFRKTRKFYIGVGNNSSGELLVKDLCKEDGMEDYDKGASKSLFDDLFSRLPKARQRAAEVLAEAHAIDGGMNPSTRLHELIDLFETLGTPQSIA